MQKNENTIVNVNSMEKAGHYYRLCYYVTYVFLFTFYVELVYILVDSVYTLVS